MDKTIMEFEDCNTFVHVRVNEFGHFVTITESCRSICLTVKGLIRIAKAVEDYMGFTEEDLEAGRQSIAEYIETLPQETHENQNR